MLAFVFRTSTRPGPHISSKQERISGGEEEALISVAAAY